LRLAVPLDHRAAISTALREKAIRDRPNAGTASPTVALFDAGNSVVAARLPGILATFKLAERSSIR
jgi:hypothetical protein